MFVLLFFFVNIFQILNEFFQTRVRLYSVRLRFVLYVRLNVFSCFISSVIDFVLFRRKVIIIDLHFDYQMRFS